jgi:hypothetical protein
VFSVPNARPGRVAGKTTWDVCDTLEKSRNIATFPEISVCHHAIMYV